MKTACYSTCGPNVCSFFCSPSLSLSPLASAISTVCSCLSHSFSTFFSTFYIRIVSTVSAGLPYFICGLFFVHNLFNTCLLIVLHNLRTSSTSSTMDNYHPCNVLFTISVASQILAPHFLYAFAMCSYLSLVLSFQFQCSEFPNIPI